MEENKKQLDIKYQYPDNPDYYYETSMKRLNLDRERELDFLKGKGFRISEPQNPKKDVKSPDSIYSRKFGPTLQDIDAFSDRYRCECGATTSTFMEGLTCKECGKPVKYIGDSFDIFGWIILKDPYYIIHPNLYNSIEFLIGKNKLINILNAKDEKDENGFDKKSEFNPKEPFAGIGILQFKNRFMEIMDYYLKQSPNKINYYDDIMKEYNNIFIQSIPVYTTHLRPYRIEDGTFSFEGTNAIYNIMAKLAYVINKDNFMMLRKKKQKHQLLFDLQKKYNELYIEMIDILSSKKGAVRTLFGGRYNFVSRCVIKPNSKLRVDEVTLPYLALVELLQQTIINILQKSYNMTYADAYKFWERSTRVFDDRVYDIIMGVINDYPRGLPVLINRNELRSTDWRQSVKNSFNCWELLKPTCLS